jgi:tRNA threonylcarbamoyladenosine biosynthesis protein TsaB
MMRILLIDTCGATGSVALAEDKAVVASASLPGRTASERLVPAIRELMAGRGVGLGALDAVAVVHGPGSFTGVRVGLSAAKGLCEAAGVGLVAISRLAVLAEMARAPSGARVRAVLDAGRGEFYFGEYVGGVCVREVLMTREEVIAAAKGSWAEGAAGDVVVVCEAGVAQALSEIAPRVVDEPVAEDALGLAMRRVREGRFEDVGRVDANYVRRTDAEIFAKGAGAGSQRARGTAAR